MTTNEVAERIEQMYLMSASLSVVQSAAERAVALAQEPVEVQLAAVILGHAGTESVANGDAADDDDSVEEEMPIDQGPL